MKKIHAAEVTIEVPQPEGFRITDIGRLVSSAIQFVLIGAGLIAFVYLLLGGIQWITSGGDKAGVDAARQKILAAVIGLIIVFATFVFIYGASTIYRCCHGRTEEVESHETIYRTRAALAGFLKGLIATGLGKLILPGILGHRKIKSPAEAVGSTVVVIFVVNLVAVLFRLNPSFIAVLSANATDILRIMTWVAPGVVIGGQIGPAIAQRLPLLYMKVYVAVLLIFVSILMFLRAFALF